MKKYGTFARIFVNILAKPANLTSLRDMGLSLVEPTARKTEERSAHSGVFLLMNLSKPGSFTGLSVKQEKISIGREYEKRLVPACRSRELSRFRHFGYCRA